MTPLGKLSGPHASACPGCGLIGPHSTGAPPAEHVASATCWRLYGELLARSYNNSDYRGVHQMIVDAYAAQHAGGKSRREVQTVALCLMTLCLFCEDAVDPRTVRGGRRSRFEGWAQWRLTRRDGLGLAPSQCVSAMASISICQSGWARDETSRRVSAG